MQGVISCITDQNGNFVKGNHTLMPFFQLALNKITVDYYEKILLANLLPKNYTICKLPIVLDSLNLNYWIFEEWKISNNILINCLPKKLTIYPHLKKQTNYTEFEQEVIYALLSGYVVDKEISTFLTNLTNQPIKGNIKYTISMLYDKFFCDNRTELVHLLKAHELDGILPTSIFPCGEYPLN